MLLAATVVDALVAYCCLVMPSVKIKQQVALSIVLYQRRQWENQYLYGRRTGWKDLMTEKILSSDAKVASYFVGQLTEFFSLQTTL